MKLDISNNERLHTISKMGAIYIEPCDPYAKFFPLEKHPSKWKQCRDACQFTWISDFGGDLKSLSSLNKLKLSLSTGFCPQLRCQLGNISQSSVAEMCPEGLCFTRVEYGSPSFGGCCFTNGSFSSEHLLGYFNKSRPVAKPIYQHSRIILGSKNYDKNKNHNADDNIHPSTKDNSWKSFISFVDTTQDALQMILEQNVDLWIQVSPSVSAKDISSNLRFYEYFQNTIKKSMCGIFPIDYDYKYFPTVIDKRYKITDLQYLEDFRLESYLNSIKYINMTYKVSQNHPLLSLGNHFVSEISPSASDLPPNCNTHHNHIASPSNANDTTHSVNLLTSNSIVSDRTLLEPFDHLQSKQMMTRSVNHIWYPSWDDFDVPVRSDDDVIMKIVSAAVDMLKRGGTVVLSCGSGR
jgi:hypothetical protein